MIRVSEPLTRNPRRAGYTFRQTVSSMRSYYLAPVWSDTSLLVREALACFTTNVQRSGKARTFDGGLGEPRQVMGGSRCHLAYQQTQKAHGKTPLDEMRQLLS